MRSYIALLAIGGISLTGCAAPETASKDFQILQAIVRQQHDVADRTNALLQTEIQGLKRELGKAKARQAWLEGAGARPSQTSDAERQAALDPEDLSRQFKEISLRIFEVENSFALDKEKNVARVQDRLENNRRDIDAMQLRFDDQSAQFSAWLASLEQKLSTQMGEHAAKLHEQLIAIGKKADQRLDAQDRQLADYAHRMDAYEQMVKTVQDENRAITIFATIAKKVDEHLEGQDRRLAEYEQRMDAFEGLVKTVRDESRAIAAAIETVRQSLASVMEALKVDMKSSSGGGQAVNPVSQRDVERATVLHQR